MPSNTQVTNSSELKNYLKSEDYQGALDYLNSSDLAPNIKFYNLGFVYYKMGKLVEAKKYFETAKYYGMLSDELYSSLKRINEELQISGVEDQYTNTENLMFAVKNLPSYQTYLIFTLLVSLILGLLYKKLTTASLVVLILMGGFIYQLYQIKDYDFEFNQSDRLIYGGPSVIFEENGVLPAGAKVLYGKSKYKWRYIEYPKVFQGWIKKENDELR